MKHMKMIGKDHLDILCRVFHCTPADLIEYKPDEYEDQDFTELANAYEEASKDYKFK